MKATIIDWLLEERDPSVRYLALEGLKPLSASSNALQEAKTKAHREGKIAFILDKMHAEGYWYAPGAGYSPKYKSTVWALLLLAQLGADLNEDPRIASAVSYYRKNAFREAGQITDSQTRGISFDCLQGNMIYALLRLGLEPQLLDEQITWLVRSQTGEGIGPLNDKKAQEHNLVGKCGPGFACSFNLKKPCAWGAIRVLMAIGQIPVAQRSKSMKRVIDEGLDLLLSVDPFHPEWTGSKPLSPRWGQLLFPLFYKSDFLHLAEAVASVGAISDPRAGKLIEFILSKRNSEGSWNLEYSDASLGGSFGPLGKPNKWVSLRALRVLEAAGVVR